MSSSLSWQEKQKSEPGGWKNFQRPFHHTDAWRQNSESECPRAHVSIEYIFWPALSSSPSGSDQPPNMHKWVQKSRYQLWIQALNAFYDK